MSRRLVAHLAIAVLLLLGAAALRVAWANAGVLDAANATALEPSALPGLLGPIDEHGRTGWLCTPEIAAGAARVRDAELPDPSKP